MHVLVNQEAIKNWAGRVNTFIRGRNLFNAKERVGPIAYDAETGVFKVKVSSFSDNVYDTAVLTEKGEPKACSCSCQDFGRQKGCCKHVVALLLAMENQYFPDEGQEVVALPAMHLLAGKPVVPTDFIAFDDLVKQSDDEKKRRPGRRPKAPEQNRQKASGNSEHSVGGLGPKIQYWARKELNDYEPGTIDDPVYLQIVFDLEETAKTSRSVSLVLGSDSDDTGQYPLDTFLEKLQQEEPIYIGRGKYWQEDQLLDRNQQGVLTFLEKTRDKALDWNQILYWMEFTGPYLKFAYRFRQRTAPLIVWEGLSPAFHLYLEEGDKTGTYKMSFCYNSEPLHVAYMGELKVKTFAEDAFFLLADTTSVLAFHSSGFYSLKQSEDRLINQVLELLAADASAFLNMSTKDASSFLNLTRSYLAHSSKLVISPALEEKIIRLPVEMTSYVDYAEGVFYLQGFFNYGDLAIAAGTGDKTFQDHQDKLLIRREEEERAYLRLIEKWGFAVGLREGQYVLTGEDEVFNFVKEGLKAFGEVSRVYITEAIRQIKLLPLPEIEWFDEPDDVDPYRDIEIAFKVGDYKEDQVKDILEAIARRKAYVKLDASLFLDLEGRTYEEREKIRSLTKFVDKLIKWGGVWQDGAFYLPAFRRLSLRFAMGKGKPQVDLPDLPSGIRAKLRPYQLEAYRWLSYLDHYRLGGILADEMGLGKTLEILSFIWSIYKQQGGIHLVVCPTSLIYNWEHEAKRFIPDMPCRVIEGNKESRLQSYKKQDEGLIIMSYGVCRQDARNLRRKDFNFLTMVLDEAQNIKNPQTKTSRAVKQLKAQRRFALTGTPIENNIVDLWSIFDFIMPGYLFDLYTFKNHFALAGSASALSLSQQQTLAKKEKAPVRDYLEAGLALAQQESLHQLVSPFVLRRLKEEVLQDLPDKIVTDIPCPMTPGQADVYETYLRRARQTLYEVSHYEGQARVRGRMTILGELTRLRQIACDPSLFIPDYAGGSGKLDVLSELVPGLLDQGHRILIFSQFTSMLSRIKMLLASKGIEMFYIDGRVGSRERLDLVERFNRGEAQVFLISLKAGGSGLNLVGADVVIHYDPWWNPAVEKQATDRAHRIGQRKVVQVFRLLTLHSIEEKIQEMQREKEALLDDIVTPGAHFIHKMDDETIKKLFE